MRCRDFYEAGSWKHPNKEILKALDAEKKSGLIHVVLCPACKMIQEHRFEGMLVIENIPEEFSLELLRLIQDFCKHAEELNSQHRLIRIERVHKRMSVTMTELALGAKLADKIEAVYAKESDLPDLVLSREPYETKFTRIAFIPPKKKRTKTAKK